MTQLLFLTDSYLCEFEATVVETDSAENATILDRTAFYPGGGGQPHDCGVVIMDGREQAVVRVTKRDDQIWHQIDGLLPPTGTRLSGRLDWIRRYQLMRTHTALHILSGIVWHDYGAQVTGGNMEPLRGRLDFEFEGLQRERIQEIEKKLQAEVAAARDVRVRILPRDQALQIPDLIRTKINLLPASISQIRTVEIVGLDLQADGGTHVANTREVGHVRISDYKSKGRINKRIHIELDPE